MATGMIEVGDEVVTLQMPGIFRVVGRRGVLVEIEGPQGVRLCVRPESLRRLHDDPAPAA